LASALVAATANGLLLHMAAAGSPGHGGGRADPTAAVARDGAHIEAGEEEEYEEVDE
jgi:hypothetical protein